VIVFYELQSLYNETGQQLIILMSEKIPRHIAIIMDGNGRWAKKNGLSRIEGHRRGAAAIDDVVEAAMDLHVSYLTLYAFSEENWKRPHDEVKALMNLLRMYLIDKRQKMISKGIRFMVIGDAKMLSSELQQEVKTTINATSLGNKMTMIVALSYGSRQEICRSVNRMISSGIKQVTVEAITDNLDTKGIPDPDLLIRTSGENRISNFLLWQLAYTELYFSNIPWPEFDKEQLVLAIQEYQRRERRFGMISEQLS